MKYCQFCGQALHDRDKFCVFCGSRQAVGRNVGLLPSPDIGEPEPLNTAAVTCRSEANG